MVGAGVDCPLSPYGWNIMPLHLSWKRHVCRGTDCTLPLLCDWGGRLRLCTDQCPLARSIWRGFWDNCGGGLPILDWGGREKMLGERSLCSYSRATCASQGEVL